MAKGVPDQKGTDTKQSARRALWFPLGVSLILSMFPRALIAPGLMPVQLRPGEYRWCCFDYEAEGYSFDANLGAGLTGLAAMAGSTTAAAADACLNPLVYPETEALRLPKTRIGFLIYPGMFLMDVMGPLTVFQSMMQREIHFLWKTAGEVQTQDEAGRRVMSVFSGTSFADCPETLDVLVIPGGVEGTFACMEDEEVLAFIRRIAPQCRFVTSVCTGSLILGAAGLLEGKRATGHWFLRDVLPKYGAIEVADRVVKDGNVITAGGVTSGIDFGMYLASILRDPFEAKAIQLYLEYDPAPPFDAGNIATAPKDVAGMLTTMFAPYHDMAMEIAARKG